MIDRVGREWKMDKEGIEVFKLIPFKRKIKIRNKKKFIIRYSLIWNPFLKTKYLGGTK